MCHPLFSLPLVVETTPVLIRWHLGDEEGDDNGRRGVRGFGSSSLQRKHLAIFTVGLPVPAWVDQLHDSQAGFR